MNARAVRDIVEEWLGGKLPGIGLGLPEYDDRIDQWLIALISPQNGRDSVGEVRDADGEVVFSTSLDMARKRCRQRKEATTHAQPRSIKFVPSILESF